MLRDGRITLDRRTPRAAFPRIPMKRALFASSGAALLAGCATSPPTSVASPKGSGDLGVVIERATGTQPSSTPATRRVLAEVPGLGDLSHASVVFSRDSGTAFVFGRDGALTRVNLLDAPHRAARDAGRQLDRRRGLAGRHAGRGAELPARRREGVRREDARAGRRHPGRIRTGRLSRVVGLADLPGQRFVFALFDADQIWVADPPPQGAKATSSRTSAASPTTRW